MDFEYKVSNPGYKLINTVVLYHYLDFYPKFIKRQQEREKIYKVMESPFETPYMNLTNQKIKINVKKVGKHPKSLETISKENDTNQNKISQVIVLSSVYLSLFLEG